DAEAEAPEVAAVGDGRVPVDGRSQPRIDVSERGGDHVRSGQRDAVELARAVAAPGLRALHARGLGAALARGQIDHRHRLTACLSAIIIHLVTFIVAAERLSTRGA